MIKKASEKEQVISFPAVKMGATLQRSCMTEHLIFPTFRSPRKEHAHVARVEKFRAHPRRLHLPFPRLQQGASYRRD